MIQATTWRRAREVFEALADGPRENRQARLAAACGEDGPLRAAVESLLEADRHPTLRPGDLVRTLEDALDWRRTGPRLGPYRILDRLAQGGMGVVFRAERADGQFEKTVAIKLLRTEVMSSPGLRRRFTVERQVLASLQHPNIAHLVDGGVARDGTPYLVMEYIDGRPITSFCDQHRLGIRQRLELLLQVADAVHHAHQRLVVHRDLKPSNILVGEQGHPKLLDFGIAKLLAGSPLRDPEAATETLDQALTPSYASPEQLAGEALTTATDLYSLAMVTFELVAGVAPFPAGSSADVAARSRASPPLEALARHGVEGAEFETLSRARGTDPRQLRRVLGSDLEKVLMKALRPEPERRYASVERFADDLRAFLADRPVQARRPSLSYRLKKFLHRNPLGTVATAAAVGLGIFAAASQIQKERTVAHERDLARAEQRRAETITSFLLGLFEQASPGKTPSGSDTAEQILDRGAARIEQQLQDQPLMRATLRHAIGKVYRRLGLYDRALVMATRSLEERRRILGDEDPAVAESLYLLGLVRFSKGAAHEAERYLQQALDIQLRTLAENDPALTDTLLALGGALRRTGKFDHARQVLEQGLSLEQSRRRDDGSYLISALSNLAMLETTVGRVGRAERLLARAVDHGAPGTTPLSLAAALNNLSVAQFKQGKIRAARASADQAWALRRDLLGAEHPVTRQTALNVGFMDLIQAEYSRADALFTEIEDTILEGDDGSRELLARVVGGRAGVAELVGDPTGARHLYARYIQLSQQAFGADNWRHADALYPAGRFHLSSGRGEIGCGYLATAQDLYQAHFGASSRRLARVMALLGRCAHEAGDGETAGRLLEAALALVPGLAERTPKSDLERAGVLMEIGRWQQATGHDEPARDAWNEVVILLEPWVRGDLMVPYVRLQTLALLHLGRLDEAARGAQRLFDRGFGPVDFAELYESFGLKASDQPAVAGPSPPQGPQAPGTSHSNSQIVVPPE